MIKVALIGVGKMGLSHLSILGAHPDVEVVGVCDTSKMIIDVLQKFSSFPCYRNSDEMLQNAKPEAVFVAVPTRYHAGIIKKIIENGSHVFAEKPLSLTTEESEDLAFLATNKKLIHQVGYHNRFVGTFRETKRIIDGGYLGEIFNFQGEAYGPVIVRTKQDNWRSDPAEGGGCLLDYASHVIDLINYILGPIVKVNSSVLQSVYSKNVEDAVFSLLELSSNIPGTLSVNWSDPTYRKMSTSITISGSNGKIICDATEFKVYFRSSKCPSNYSKGWNIKYITDFAEKVDFYLRGEEYSAQVDYFIKAIQNKVPNNINTFQHAAHTDRIISLIKKSKKNN